MRIVEITPYSTIEQKRFANDTLIKIKADSFQEVQFDGERTTFSFFECSFRKVTIQNSENIELENISIQFFGCYIDDIQIDEITSKNISIRFYTSILSGRISSGQLLS